MVDADSMGDMHRPCALLHLQTAVDRIVVAILYVLGTTQLRLAAKDFTVAEHDQTGFRKEILSCGPLCVAPEFQRQRLGKLLLEHSFALGREMGYDVNVNFGNPGNYVSRGFVSCKKKNVCCFAAGNFPTALLVRELVPGAQDGRRWMYIPSTAADCCEDRAAVEAFDASFQPREKKWMPSQEEFYIYRHSSVVR